MEKKNNSGLNYVGIFGILISVAACIICGCAESRHTVVAVTGTNIGLQIGVNPATQIPEGKLGYQRGEIAIVPSNRSVKEDPGVQDAGSGSCTGGQKILGDGAKGVADVLMELRFSNIFSGNASGIYQRLAVGTTAVQQSALMFARDDRGDIDAETAKAIKNIEAIDHIDSRIEAEKRKITDLYKISDAGDQTKIKTAVTNAGYKDWNAFIDGEPNEPSLKTLEKIKKELKSKGLTVK